MKKIICKNCGGEFADTLSKCPYCGTMNRKGAYREFREKVESFVDQMLGLKVETQKSLSKMILNAFLRALLIIFVVSLAAFLVSMTMNVNYYSNKEYDQEAYEDLIWEDENYDKLEIAYQNDDFETIRKLYYENSRIVSHWPHYDAYALKQAYKDITEEEYFNEYVLDDILYFLYYPQYFMRGGYYRTSSSLSEEELAEYEEMKTAVYTMMAEKGFTPEQLQKIYEQHADGYGYISSSDLRQYIKEDGNA